MTPVVVGLTGYAQHGKDTVGNRLVERWGFTRFAFADRLRQLAYDVNPTIRVTVREALGLRILPGAHKLQPLIDRFGYERVKKIRDARDFYQRTGTEGVRGNLGVNAWVDATEQAILASGAERVVITDCRFPNEFGYVKRFGSLIRVTRLNADGTPFDNGVGKDHPSEMHVASAPADFNIVAVSGQMDYLLAKADAVAIALGAEEGY